MTTFEKIMFTSVFAAVFPLALFLGGWWGSLPFAEEIQISKIAGSGFAVGLLLALLSLKRVWRAMFTFHSVTLGAVFLFYSLGVFGFFMGVPVFNLGVGVGAGWFIGRKLAQRQVAQPIVTRTLTRISVFTTVVFILICGASALLALTDPFTAANLQGMFKLPFTVTRPILFGLIIVGGGGLTGLHWRLANLAARRAFQSFQHAMVSGVEP